MSSVHVARQGFITKSALPSVSRARGSTTVADNKTVLLLNGNGTNGAQNNTFVTDNFGTGGQGNYSVAFDGTGDSITAASNTAFSVGTGDFTIEFWGRWNAVSGSSPGNLFTCVNSGTLGVWVSDTSFQLARAGQGGDLSATVTQTTGVWNHYAITRESGTARIFKDGVLLTSGTVTTNYGQNGIAIGGSLGSSTNGFVANFRLIKGTALYTSTFTPPTSNLTAISGTSLLTCQSSHIVDNSTNNFAITANGDAKVATNTSSVPIAIIRNGNATQGSFSPFTLPDGQWSNFFDGTGDYLTIPSGSAFQFGTGDFTIESWVYINATPTFEYILDARNSGQQTTWAFAFGLGTSGRLGFFYGTTTILEEASVSVTPHTWVHCAVARSGTTISLFINGTRVATTTDTTNYSVSPTISYIGARFSAVGSMNGYLSNVRTVKGTAVYNPTLTTLTVPTTSLTAITNTSLLTCQSNRFGDNSSNNFAITRNGDVRVTPWSPFAPTSAYDPATNGGSGYFDGTGDYLTSTTNSAFAVGTGDFTVEFFSYGIGTGDGLGICDTRANSGSAGFWISNNTAASRGFRYGTTGAVLLTVSGEVLNNWQHIAVVRNSGTVTIYVNGVSQGSVTDTRNYTDTSCFVGSFTGGAGPYFGYISNFRFVKGTAVYTSAFTPPTAPVTNITNTSLLLNFTNAGIFDAAGDCILETVGDVKIDTAVKKYGSGSLVFDGNTDALIISNNTPLLAFGSQNFTVECWFRRNNTNNVATIFRGDSGGGGGTGLEIIFSSSNDLIMGLNGGAPNIVTVSSGTHGVTTNTWYHGAFVRNGNTWTIYVNGVAVGSATNTSTISTPTFYRVGSNSFSTTMSFNGYIDDFRVTLGQARYTANFTPPTAELITYGTSDNIVNNSTYGVYQLA